LAAVPPPELTYIFPRASTPPVVRPERRILAERAARRRPARQVERGRRLEHERVRRVVGGDPLEQLAVLVRHDDVRLVGRRHRCVRLDADVHARERRSRLRVEEEHVPGRDERENPVCLARVEEKHVGPHGRRARLGEAQGSGSTAEVDPLGDRGRAAPLERAAVVDVERAAARGAGRVRLVDRPHLVGDRPGTPRGARERQDEERE
jgi:hypothetical protein